MNRLRKTIMHRSRKDPAGNRRGPPVKCPVHGGQSDTAVVCRHLAQTEGKLGYRLIASSDDPYREIAWCDRCEAIRKKAGCWTPEAMTGAGLEIVCLPCYHECIARHNLQLVAPDLGDYAGICRKMK
jgi:hypothetical protein